MGINVTAGNTATLTDTLWGSGAWANSTDWGGGGTIATGTLNWWGDPAFADPSTWDYHLTSASAAIDRGVDAGVADDLDGNPRPQGSAPDLGAYEYSGPFNCFAQVVSSGDIYSSTLAVAVQRAVDAAVDGDTVKVAGYCPDVEARVGLNQSVYISKTLTLRGGYTTTNWTTSDSTANPTTLDAQGQGRVLVISGTITPTIEGLRITGGDATGLGGGIGGDDAGGGVHVVTATATISNCQVYSNTAGTAFSSHGGGVYAFTATVTLSGNAVYSNTAVAAGGGICLNDCDGATLSSNAIHNNMAVFFFLSYGGGIYLANSDSATLSSNDIYSNTAGGGYDYGGGVYLENSHGATLSGNAIYSNTAGGSYGTGGGVCLVDSNDAMLRGNAIYDNLTVGDAGWGGGVSLAGSDARLDNNVITDNQLPGSGSASGVGSGMYVASCTADLRHNTLAHNTGGDGSGIHVTHVTGGDGSTVALTNTILVSHTVGITVTAGSTATLESTLWGSGAWANGTDWSGAGTITPTNNYWGDPVFVNPAAWDYHIQTTSAALDAGLFAGVTDDVDGDARPTNPARPDVPDLGYDENKQLTVQRAVTDTMTFGAACARLVFTDTGGLSAITITVVPGQFPSSNPSDQVISRTVTITPSSSAIINAGLSLCYEDDEVRDGLSESNLRLYRWTGSQWQGYPSTADPINNLVTGIGVASLSRWLIGEGNPTAVTLARFTARAAGDGNGLVLPLVLVVLGVVGTLLWGRRR